MLTTSINMTAALFLVLILLGVYGVSGKISRSLRFFRICVWACLSCLIFDGISYLYTGEMEVGSPGFWVNYLAYISVEGLTVSYTFFLGYLLEEKGDHLSPVFISYILLLCCLDLIFLTIGAFRERLFSFQDGREGPWAPYSLVVPIFCALSLWVFLFGKRWVLGRSYTAALGSYIFLSLLPALFRMFIPGFQPGYVGPALSVMAIYVLILSREIGKANVRAELYNTLSIQDGLTGLKNRRGYDELIEAASREKDSHLGVVFCDINSLKYVNDYYGHEAGDELIKRMAQLLKEAFSDGEICRISGDEFVVFLYLSTQTSFEGRMAVFALNLEKNERIASMGYSAGKGALVRELIRAAEARMYEDKNRYYEETKRSRRR